MTGDGYTVHTGELAAHATSVRQAGDALGQALAAGQQVTMGVRAYGLICGPLFVPIVLAVSTPGLDSLKVAQDAMTTAAGTVTKSADSYRKTEDAHVSKLRSLQTGLVA